MSAISNKASFHLEYEAAAVALPALAAFAVTAFAPQLFNDGDTYWHIMAGAWMLDHHSVLRTDPFSFTFAGAPWETHEWLSEVLMALVFRLAGWTGLTILFALASGAAVLLLALKLRRWLEPLPLLVLLVVVFGCIGMGLLARPHILALPFLVLWMGELLDARHEQRTPYWRYLSLMAVWANLHGSFFFGLALIAPFAVEAIVEANENRPRIAMSWAGFFGGALVASLATPHGLNGLIFPIKLMAMTELASIKEWQSVDFQTPQPLELTLLVALYIFLSRNVRVPFFRLLLLLAMLHMALQHIRQQTILVVCGSLILAEPLARALNTAHIPITRGRAPALSTAGIAALVLAVGLTALRLSFPVIRTDDQTSPISALAQVPGDVRLMPVFNDYYFGGFLIFAGVKPFIDSRAELYGDDFLHNYREITGLNGAAQDATFRKYNIRWTFLRPDNAANALLDASPLWRRLYTDAFAVIHVRTDVVVARAGR